MLRGAQAAGRRDPRANQLVGFRGMRLKVLALLDQKLRQRLPLVITRAAIQGQLKRPVDATAWLKEVCILPVLLSTSWGRAST